jgi:hypothetical protein
LWNADEAMHRLCTAVADHPNGWPIESLRLPSA